MHKCFISVCIPTFNRCGDLTVTINDLLRAYGNSEEVEIIICDNASTDGTSGYLSSINSIYNNLTITFQNENYGFDKNLLDCYMLARGEYVHFLGDDDLINYDAFGDLINILKSDMPDIIISNYEIHTNNRVCSALNIPKKQFERIEDLFSYIGHYTTFMSAITLKKDYKINDFIKYDGLKFMHIAILLETYAGRVGKFAYSNRSLVVATDDNKLNYSVEELFTNRLITNFVLNSHRISQIKLLDFYQSVFRFVYGNQASIFPIIRVKSSIFKASGCKLFFDIRLILMIAKKTIKKLLKNIRRVI